ncbi:helix-hairpin-helix domain-containing protein [Streptomyces sp. NPDC002851]
MTESDDTIRSSAADSGEADREAAAEDGDTDGKSPTGSDDTIRSSAAESSEADREAAAEDGDAGGESPTGSDDTIRSSAADSGEADREAAAEGSDAGGESPTEGDDADGSSAGQGGDAGEASAAELSEAEAELAAQQELRRRIEQRKAERGGPVESGAKLSGTAADLLAAVRAVEAGEKPPSTVFSEPEPARRRPAPEPVRRPQPTAPAEAPPPDVEAVAAVRSVLTRGGAPETLAPQVTSVLGEGADSQLQEDPWQLLRVPGVRPEQADGFARALLGEACGPGDERRGRALTVWLLEQAALAGHTALEAPALEAALTQRSVPDPDAAVQSAVTEGDVLVFQDALDAPQPVRPAAESAADGEETEAEAEVPVRVLVGLERYALAEESLADGLARIVNSLAKDGSPDEGAPGPDAWESTASAAKGSAAELIRAVAGHGLVLHSGGEAARAEPAALVAAARDLGLRVWAATHTEDGQHRFAALIPGTGAGARDHASGAPGTHGTPGAPGAPGTETAGSSPAHAGQAGPDSRPASPDSPDSTDSSTDSPDTDVTATVAGLLAGAEGPGRDADGALALDLLVVLDAPQLDVETAAMLVESLPDGARLVLSGDPGVLWSAGPGRVFADLLAARTCPFVVSRTPDPGPIGELVSGIGVGELTQVEAPGKEVVIVPVRDAGEAVHRTVQLVADSVPRAFGIPADGTQVITVGHGGAAGTRALNAALKERLNPGPGRFGGFDAGDRVAYTPAPGRTRPGRVVGADAEGLRLDCAGTPVHVPKERVERTVRHGWALTAHQAVGRRWPAAVVVLPGDAAGGLTRSWVYTAFGRGERHLSVVHGVEGALAEAVANTPAKPRTTRLPVLLRGQESQQTPQPQG